MGNKSPRRAYRSLQKRPVAPPREAVELDKGVVDAEDRGLGIVLRPSG